jgi:DnaK suppressor protein
MNKEQIALRIKEEIESTAKSIETFRELSKPIAPENAIGRVSRMDAINNKSVNEVALRKAELRLKNLQVAMSKIHDIDFGICLRCKNVIPIARIMLLPQSVFCVNCAK